MSQASHTIYKQLVPLEKKYKYYKRSGPGGIRDDVYQSMILHYKYDFLKKKLEYLLVSKRDNYMERLWTSTSSIYLSDEGEKLIEYKLNNDTELIQLKRTIIILKIQLKKKGYKPEYL